MTTTAPARFLLLGDSHAGPIGRAAQAAGVPFQGGPVGAGREFTDGFFTTHDTPAGRDIVFRSAEAQERYRRFLGELGVDALADLSIPLVSTFGFCAHFVALRENWDLYRDRSGAVPAVFLSSALFDAIVRAAVRDALAFYGHAVNLGLRVLAVMPPQRVPGQSDPAVFMAAQESIRRAVARLGVEVVDLRGRTTGPDGLQRPWLCGDDEIHGNLAFGRIILAELLDRGL
ncbi:SGNH/GDSL hydrolase family protein [Streptomyces sp. NPDC093228]|uniref:SGNH/GDSL hydrolase family protein n=1 Tax=Streptomyces sp. NPDC093228 TaxID=3155070 RepID=UPI00343F0EE1